ncbi:hypothetical protein COX00_01720 [Candidatus Uhrbacteria bacterium CG22_combo_CG10-13_8_21_14_all_47_17]|uniref:Uncharacterized protein n=1 Tax=Candidatus Uhrbacteria bacterium CG22_combo_CG10-13_8_21_14_all_47_17 TaxID=1975041 RepID=A0A2H0BUQ9_9BACT|nr:MAG: hypothetical protein COX00_01720 [Candidatus Uhrbacteria bacterium CG22_combo_CG10-13_8_21_14_all_47_17]
MAIDQPIDENIKKLYVITFLYSPLSRVIIASDRGIEQEEEETKMGKRATSQEIANLLHLIEVGRVSQEMVRRIIDEQSHDLARIYRVTIQSTTQPTYIQISKTYEWSSCWGEESSHIELHESLQGITPPVGELQILVKSFPSDIRTEEVLAWAKENGYRVLFPHERERFLKKFPELQLQQKLWMVDLGSFARLCHERYVPVSAEEHSLERSPFHRDWPVGFHFLFAAVQPPSLGS